MTNARVICGVAIDVTFIKSYWTSVKHTNHKHIVKHYPTLKPSIKKKEIKVPSTATFGIIRYSVIHTDWLSASHNQVCFNSEPVCCLY